MEEKKEVTHSLHLEQRGHGLVTGVTEMKSFDEENIFMETSQSDLYTGEKRKKERKPVKKAVSVDEHLYGERTGTAGTKYDLRCSSCSGL